MKFPILSTPYYHLENPEVRVKIKDTVHPVFHLPDFYVKQTVQNSQNFFIRITSVE